MSLFNEKLKHISLKELLSFIIFLFLLQYLLNISKIIYLDPVWIYLLVIFYFIFRLKGNFPSESDYAMIFNENVLKQVFLIVVLNVFLSYGFLYLSDYLLALFPSLNSLPADMLFNSIVGLNLLGTIFVSPISEELIFRGVFLNRLQLIVPSLFAVLISSLFFASLHSFGSITSAFIFGLSMAVLYLKTDNVMVPIFAHFLNNLIAEIIVNVDTGKILFTNPSVVMIMSLLALASFVMISFLIADELKNI